MTPAQTPVRVRASDAGTIPACSSASQESSSRSRCLGVDGAGLPGGDAEVGGVEPVDGVEEPPAPGDAGSEPVGVPPPGRDGSGGVASVEEEAPEGVGPVGSGEPAGHADDGDGLRPT